MPEDDPCSGRKKMHMSAVGISWQFSTGRHQTNSPFAIDCSRTGLLIRADATDLRQGQALQRWQAAEQHVALSMEPPYMNSARHAELKRYRCEQGGAWRGSRDAASPGLANAAGAGQLAQVPGLACRATVCLPLSFDAGAN